MKASRTNSAAHRCIVEPLESRQMFAAAGTLDATFGEGGKLNLSFGLNGSPVRTLFAKDVAVQPDGKTVVAARFDDPKAFGDTSSDFALVRLNFDGTLDKTFGPKKHPGIVIQHLGKAGERVGVSSVAIQSDGKIVVAGGAIRARTAQSDPFEMAVARFRPNGSLDTSFDGDGMRFIEFGGSSANDIALQDDGKIVLVGTRHEGFFNNFDDDFAIARLNRNGSLDKSFDGDGMLTIGLGELDEANGVAIQDDGKIVIVGSSGPFTDRQIALVRLKPNGSKDTTFGSGGTVRTRLAGVDESKAKDVLLQAGGKIVVLAEVDQNPAPKLVGIQMGLVRYNANGKLDTTFGDSSKGFVISNFGGLQNPARIIRSSRGGLIASSFTDGKFTLTGFTFHGKRDTAFGKNGRVVVDFGAAGTANFGGVTNGPGNRIVMVGGDKLKTARVLDYDTNVVSITRNGGQVTEGSAVATSFTVGRSEVLPVPTRVFFNFGGTATNNVDYTTSLRRVLTPQFIIGTSTSTPAPPPGDAFIDIPAGAKTVAVNITARADATLEGTEIGVFTIASNASYTVGNVAQATARIIDSTAIQVNFQAPGTVPGGYVADVGQVFGDRGNGLSYGWDANNTGNVRIRNNTGSPDARFDTLALMQKDGANRKWELALPNGMYEVHLVAGDPSFTDSVYKINLESRFAISGAPAGDVRWFQRTMNIQVNDGRLTLSNNSGGVNNKIAFMEIKPAAPGAVEGPVTANEPISLVSPPPAKPAPKLAATVFSQVVI